MGKLDIIVYGATGFTGSLVAAYLSKTPGLRWAVTGAGHHSENHVAKIKPAAIALFKERRLKFSEINAGDLKVHLK